MSRAVAIALGVGLPSLALLFVGARAASATPKKKASGGPPPWIVACRARLERARDDAAKAGIPVGGVKASVRSALIGKEPVHIAALELVIGLVEASTSHRTPTAWSETNSGSVKRGFRDGAGRSVQYSLPVGDPDWTKLVPFVRPALDDCLAAKGAP